VNQLRAALQARQPRLRVLSPREGQVLPAGDWSLELELQDWPLVDAGDLGLGPHVVVQVDQQAPLRISGPDPAAPLVTDTAPGDTRLRLTLPPMEPGSHRVTVYAARPWGEAVKAGGASDQIRVHRVAPNPLGVPAPGTPQLIPVSPEALSPGQPVLIDWLLRDAPLQGLREGDEGWRLRITVNGDSFLVDENTPLWLRGWRNGSNTVLLELVDAQGAPLNPPFNSVVREVWIDPKAPVPAWASGPLSPDQQALVLGERPLPPPQSSAAAPLRSAPSPPSPASDDEHPVAATASTDEATADRDAPPMTGPGNEANLDDAQEGRLPSENTEAAAASAEASGADPFSEPDRGPDPEESEPINLSAAQPPEAILPSSGLEGSARDQLNPDGTLIQPRREGVLSGLRERWAR
jgi:hypothetical protein